MSGALDDPRIDDAQVLDPDLPIIDAHHHLWMLPASFLDATQTSANFTARALAPVYRANARYGFDELRADLASGHNVRATVHVDAQSLYRYDGPEALRSVGEVEFVNGIAAMFASGQFGPARPCAGIVGGIDLRLGEAVEEVLIAHLAAGGGRYRGVRSPLAYDDDSGILGGGSPNIASDPAFRAGFSRLSGLGLSFDAWVLEPQLPDLVALAQNFPDTSIILNHAGTPLLVGRFAGRRAERFETWRRQIRALAECPNVAVKLSGFGMPFSDSPSFRADPPASSAVLAAEWAPYVETCISAFGAERCMFASNFPVDGGTANYRTLWNAFKRLAAGCSAPERTALFSGTAARLYRIAG